MLKINDDVVTLTVVRGTAVWEVQEKTDEQGRSVLIATGKTLKSVLWGYTIEEIQECIRETVELLLQHLHQTHRLRQFASRVGFEVEDYRIVRSTKESEKPSLYPVNGTSSVIRPHAAA